ncbi:hypothetical protein [Streptomyces sp. NPDC001312]|uniref:hypothetical protein n=1 Tax=Streptomyces sp. NPDC001312 TaxID=3364561 RepID=UPI003673AE41
MAILATGDVVGHDLVTAVRMGRLRNMPCDAQPDNIARFSGSYSRKLRVSMARLRMSSPEA